MAGEKKRISTATQRGDTTRPCTGGSYMAAENNPKKKKKVVIFVPEPRPSAKPEQQTRDVSELTLHPLHQVFPELSEEAMKHFVSDIEVNGLQHALEITPDGRVISGRKRLKALRRLGKETVEVIVRHDLSAAGEEAVARRVIEANLDRQHLSKLDLARACKVLMEMGPKGSKRRGQGELKAMIGDRLGLSGKTVDRLIKLLELPAELQQAVADKKLPEVRANALMKMTPAEVEPILAMLREGKHIRRAVDRLLMDKLERPPMTSKTLARTWRYWLLDAETLATHQKALTRLVDPRQCERLRLAHQLAGEALRTLGVNGQGQAKNSSVNSV